ncbi:luciferase family oxidoreductase, group 1 [Novosphingobium sp. CF614]|uniref:LLM class flavin-dependent oxidoreductase n=1 Tax=Novosphingobium sp. CF614 TaxID=1884364 RepID=UPI0008E3A172|nr:LLM class flavin-dependent oxidoreductase [Novosphingobium sp. CF614]SFG47098.1 luciferase family oxidoreductase, group 1 [Novosphingobium sp. CF614]
MTPLSILDVCPIIGSDAPTDALNRTRELAQAAEKLGFHRYWISEHHNMPGTASAATAVVISHLAAATQSMRIGSGGVMLPNHAPLVVAEQFGTLAALYPGRIDLGLGRSPGTDQMTVRALRRDPRGAENFARDLAELQLFLGKAAPDQTVRAIPGQETDVPIWLLGSSPSSAKLAAEKGMSFAFAAHVTPNGLFEAIETYRSSFRPSSLAEKPHFMPCINIFAADTDEAAHRHFSSALLGMMNFFRGRMGPILPPVDNIEALWTPQEKATIMHMHHHTIVGSAATVQERLCAFIAATGADEIMIAGNFFDPAARIRSLELIAGMSLCG